MNKKRRLVEKKEKKKKRNRKKWRKKEREGKERISSGLWRKCDRDREKGGRGIERRTVWPTTIGVSKACRHLGNMRCDRTVYCVSA